VELGEILKIGGLAGVVSAFFGALFKEASEWMERRRKARFLALKLSVLLEEYFRACTDRLSDIEIYVSSHGQAGEIIVGLPDFPELPSDTAAAWLYLKPDVADAILGLPIEIRLLDDGIRFNTDMDGGPDVNPDWTLEPLCKVALETLDLAKRTRRLHWLKRLTRTSDTEQWVCEARDKLALKHARRDARSIEI
jgi:hypothetical protein